MEVLINYISELVSNNYINSWYIILFIAMLYFLIHKSSSVTENQKIGILNICVYLICFFNILATKFVIFIYLITLFIYFFVLNPLRFKDSYLKHPLMFFLDFIYRLFVKYGFLYLIIALLLSSDFVRNFFGNLLFILFLITGYLVCRSVIECVDDNTFKWSSLTEIEEKVTKISDYKNFKVSDKLRELSEMLVYKEDKSFFERSHSYNWCCLQFAWYRIIRFFKYALSFKICHIKVIGIFAYVIITIWHILTSFVKIIWQILKRVWYLIKYLCRSLFIWKSKPKVLKQLFDRGYSTIEMQVIRTISLDEPQKIHYIKRKLYELIYSYIFFKCLKENLNCHDNLKFKYYIIDIYLHVAPLMVNDQYYANIYSFFERDLDNISKEEFYIYMFGVSFDDIGEYILNYDYVKVFNLDKESLQKLVGMYR